MSRHTRPSQAARILQHLRERGPITPLEALELHGVLRLAARIHELRAEGHPIACESIGVKTRAGWTNVTKYRLED